MFRFEVPSRLFFGKDSRLEILPILRDAGLKRLGVVIDEALPAQEAFRAFLEEDIPAASLSITAILRSRSGREPDYGYLDECSQALPKDALDAVLGIGGGSAMDLAKGIAILMTNPGKGIDYRGMDKVASPGLPVVLFPTTAGTGSEATKTASFVDCRGQTKLGINGRHVAAWAGVLDPVLALDCPPGPTMAAGMDALVHCVESFTAMTSSVLARDMAKAAFPRLFNNLERAVSRPKDLDGRQEMMLGAYQAGIAMWNAAGGGPASGISYPLGVRHGVPHGFAGGLLLPHVVRHNVSRGYQGYEPLFDLIEGRPEAPADKSRAFAEAFEGLYRRCGAPRDFGRWGVDSAAVAALVEDTVAQRAANLTHNPVPFGRADVEEILNRACAPRGNYARI
ncbi:MAG: iron-containing alcohol dehydrogenase [Elusimicrobia bacterium]|nr:iron-containing alcohol dehydrogenase [Elusimicrobiota bacterium]